MEFNINVSNNGLQIIMLSNTMQIMWIPFSLLYLLCTLIQKNTHTYKPHTTYKLYT